MNICCGEGLDKGPLKKFDDLYLTLDETTLIFLADKGIFDVYDSDDEKIGLGSKKKEYEDLKIRLEIKEKEEEDWNRKLNELDKKLANMEKVLLQDDREKQYIRVLGENQKNKLK